MNKTKRMTSIAILGAICVVLGLISNYVTIGSVNINLALIPIVVGACIYGPLVGLGLGVIDGIIIMFAPSTLTYFISHNVLATIVLCLVKTGLAGYLSGILFKLLKSKNDLFAVIVASLIVPVVNTLIFLGGVFLFFIPVYANLAKDNNVIVFIITSILTINFLIEFIVNLVLSPSIYRVIKYKKIF